MKERLLKILSLSLIASFKLSENERKIRKSARGASRDFVHILIPHVKFEIYSITYVTLDQSCFLCTRT